MAPTYSRPVQSAPDQIETISDSHKHIKALYKLLQKHGFNYSIHDLVKILKDVVTVSTRNVFELWIYDKDRAPINPVQLPFKNEIFVAIFQRFASTMAIQRLTTVFSSLFFLAKGNPLFRSIPGFENDQQYQKQNMTFFLVFAFQYLIVYAFMVPSIANKPIFNGLLQNPLKMDKFKKHVGLSDAQLPTLFFLLKDTVIHFWVSQFTKAEYFYEEHSAAKIIGFITETDVMQDIHTEMLNNLMKCCDIWVVCKHQYTPQLPLLFRFSLNFIDDDDEIHDKKQTALDIIQASKSELVTMFPHMKDGLDILSEPKNGKFLECDELHSIKQHPAYKGKMILI